MYYPQGSISDDNEFKEINVKIFYIKRFNFLVHLFKVLVLFQSMKIYKNSIKRNSEKSFTSIDEN